MHLVAERAAQTVDGRCALHRPALDDQWRNLVYLVGSNEVHDPFG
jgi:hypothetical protein